MFDGKAASSATRARTMGTTGNRDRRSTTLEVSMVEGSNIGVSDREVGRSRRGLVVVNRQDISQEG